MCIYKRPPKECLLSVLEVWAWNARKAPLHLSFCVFLERGKEIEGGGGGVCVVVGVGGKVRYHYRFCKGKKKKKSEPLWLYRESGPPLAFHCSGCHANEILGKNLLDACWYADPEESIETVWQEGRDTKILKERQWDWCRNYLNMCV